MDPRYIKHLKFAVRGLIWGECFRRPMLDITKPRDLPGTGSREAFGAWQVAASGGVTGPVRPAAGTAFEGFAKA